MPPSGSDLPNLLNPTASALQAAHWGLHPVVIAVLEAIASGLASDYKEIIFHRDGRCLVPRDGVLHFPTKPSLKPLVFGP
jgi:hypothetical protein